MVAAATAEPMEQRWSAVSRYDRQAKVTDAQALTPTGTMRVAFEVIDDRPFSFEPGQFIGIQHKVKGLGWRRSPYCIMSAPSNDRSFELLVRVVPDGPLSCHLGSLQLGDIVNFRGPTGRSMVPKDRERELVLLATGVGVGPFYSLAKHVLSEGFDRPIALYWGLRLVEDVCLLDELDHLAAKHPNFSYHVSLSQPPNGWNGLRGRLSKSVPPLLACLADKRFYLCGNGAMIEEMASVLVDLGVGRELVYEEPYFNRRHRPGPEVLASIRARFEADDLASPCAQPSGSPFGIESPLNGRRRSAAAAQAG